MRDQRRAGGTTAAPPRTAASGRGDRARPVAVRRVRQPDGAGVPALGAPQVRQRQGTAAAVGPGARRRTAARPDARLPRNGAAVAPQKLQRIGGCGLAVSHPRR